jgi:hypothetical protein
MEFFSKMAFQTLNASQGPFAPQESRRTCVEIREGLSDPSGIVMQDGLDCRARERGDEWRNVH